MIELFNFGPDLVKTSLAIKLRNRDLSDSHSKLLRRVWLVTSNCVGINYLCNIMLRYFGVRLSAAWGNMDIVNKSRRYNSIHTTLTINPAVPVRRNQKFSKDRRTLRASRSEPTTSEMPLLMLPLGEFSSTTLGKPLRRGMLETSSGISILRRLPTLNKSSSSSEESSVESARSEARRSLCAGPLMSSSSLSSELDSSWRIKLDSSKISRDFGLKIRHLSLSHPFFSSHSSSISEYASGSSFISSNTSRFVRLNREKKARSGPFVEDSSLKSRDVCNFCVMTTYELKLTESIFMKERNNHLIHQTVTWVLQRPIRRGWSLPEESVLGKLQPLVQHNAERTSVLINSWLSIVFTESIHKSLKFQINLKEKSNLLIKILEIQFKIKLRNFVCLTFNIVYLSTLMTIFSATPGGSRVRCLWSVSQWRPGHRVKWGNRSKAGERPLTDQYKERTGLLPYRPGSRRAAMPLQCSVKNRQTKMACKNSDEINLLPCFSSLLRDFRLTFIHMNIVFVFYALYITKAPVIVKGTCR